MVGEALRISEQFDTPVPAFEQHAHLALDVAGGDHGEAGMGPRCEIGLKKDPDQET